MDKRVNRKRRTNLKEIFNPTLFWDARHIDLDANAGYVISRILNFGDWIDIQNMMKLYPEIRLIETVKRNRNLLPQVGKFWAIRFNIPLKEVACLKKYYQ